MFTHSARLYDAIYRIKDYRAAFHDERGLMDRGLLIGRKPGG